MSASSTNTIVLLNPVLGGKIRGVIATIFGVFIVVQSYWPELAQEGWAGTVTKVYGAALAIIELLTHITPVGGTRDEAIEDIIVDLSHLNGDGAPPAGD